MRCPRLLDKGENWDEFKTDKRDPALSISGAAFERKKRRDVSGRPLPQIDNGCWRQ
jgi:hypothetical protein